ncbi:MAG: hypothetical protein LBL84_03960 [Candidatus Nomurabacteria bacterium]|jgi:hypothetical protein|nr:hypothetical protein [Candidatus Nomurabacteria bacterium]
MATNPFFKVTVGQLSEFHRVLGEMGFGDEEVKAVLHADTPAVKLAELMVQLVGGEFVFPEAIVIRDYDHLLPSLCAQAEVTISGLQKFGRQLGLSHDQLIRLCNSLRGMDHKRGGRAQTIADCQVVIAWLGSLCTTVHFYQMLVEDRQVTAGAAANWYGADFDKLRMEFDETAYRYGTDADVFVADGVNLVDNWDRENGSSVNQARATARAKRQDGEEYYLISIEALVLYATADPKLYRSQDGESLPYYDMAGIRSGGVLVESPFSIWHAGDRQVIFNSFRAGCVRRDVARPSLRGVSRV